MPSRNETPNDKRRVRTGCLPCRRRRRKCDELKPRCANCTKRNANCQYPGFAHVTAREIATHGITSPSSTLPSSDELLVYPSSANDVDQRLRRDHSRSTDAPDEVLQSTDGALSFLVPESSAARPERPPPPHRSQTVPSLAQAGITLPPPPRRPIERSQLQTSPSRAIDAVLHGSISPATHDRRSSIRDDERSRQLSRSNARNSEPAQQDTASELELMCHFRYNIAPWLDIIDSDSFFGVKLMLLAREHRSVLAATLAIAARHMHRRTGMTRLVVDEYSTRYRQEAESKAFYETGSIRLIVRTLLLLDTLFCSNLSQWRVHLRDFFASTAFTMRDTSQEALRLFSFKIDLAEAVVARHPLSTETLTSFNDSHLGSPHQSQLTGNLALLQALAGALSLAYPTSYESTPDTQTSSPSDYHKPSSWTDAWTTCQAWYLTRAPELRPVIDCRPLEASQIDPTNPSSLPIIIYSSARALLPNAIYHLTSLILLTCKPRLVKIPVVPATAGRESSSSSANRRALSESWHVQSIAGIPCRNEFKEQWDPLLVAALLYIGPKLTHRAQQEVLIECLGRAGEVTGLVLDEEVGRLRAGWAV